MRAPVLCVLGLLTACGGPSDEYTVPNPAAAHCGETDPAIVDLSITDAGLIDFGGTTYPAIDVTADTHDEDGDLHYRTVRVWYDEVIDGDVDITAPYHELYGPISENDCQVYDVDMTVRIGITGSDPDYDTELEWAVLVYDDMHRPSDAGVPAIAVFRTPKEDGTYSTR